MICEAMILVTRLLDPSGAVVGINLQCGLTPQECNMRLKDPQTGPFREVRTCELEVPPLAREREI